MIALTLVLCLANPQSTVGDPCFRWHQRPYETSLAACQIAGEMLAADWLRGHPDYRLDKVECGWGAAPGDAG